MNAQERDQLSQFLKQLVEFKLAQKDSDAETLIREAVTQQPDAAYLLVQKSLLQEQALNVAKAKISELQNQLQRAGSASSSNNFLSSDPWAQTATASPMPGAGNYQRPGAAPVAGNAPFSAAPAQNAGSGFGSSFLGNVATTAAGVVAGSFLFQGIESLMGHHQSGFGQQPAGEKITEETVINNYYGDSDQLANNDNNDFLAGDDSDSFFDGSGSGDDSDWV